MIEEIAKAAYDRRSAHTKQQWHSLADEDKAPYLLDAIAFLEILRKPTPAMLTAGSNYMKKKDWLLPREYLEKVWVAMVQAALE